MIAPLVGIAVVGAVAVKTVEVIGNTVNQTQGQLKKKKKSKKKSNNIFDMDNVFDAQPKKRKSRPRQKQNNNNNNVFSTGFGF